MFGKPLCICYIQHSANEYLTSMLRTTMHMRFLATIVLASALLFSQGGNLLVAALCPHLRMDMASCEQQAAAAPMSHEDMGHMDDGQMEHEAASQPSGDAFALGQPTDPCSHCAVHSRTSSNTASLRASEAVKRSVALNTPVPVSRIAPVTLSLVPALTSRAHGPPGHSTSRYILINIFRI